MQALKDLDYIIQERTILENILNCEFQNFVTDSTWAATCSISTRVLTVFLFLLNTDKGVFYIDNGHSFDQILFYGNEGIFFQVELLLFCCVVLLTGNYLLALVVIGIVYKCFEVVMNFALKNNLAKKTLIDKRFLI